MNKKIKRLVVMTVCILLIMAQASAQRIEFKGEECPLQIIDPAIVVAEGEEPQPQEVSVHELEIFGRNEAGNLVVLCNGNTAGYIAQSVLEELLPTLDLSGIGEWTYPETILKGTHSDDVLHFQALLNSLNYDCGTADGKFGNKTEIAITAYQTDMGFEINGIFDFVTQLSLEGKASFNAADTIEIIYPITYDPVELYKAIYGKVQENLQAFADAGWSLSYDEFDGRGELNARAQLGGYENDATQVDRLQLTSKLIVRVEDVLTGTPRLYPALRVISKGASSVYMRSIDIKRGSDVAKLELLDSTRSLEGLDLYEEANFMITDEALQVMNDVEKGELSVRLNCQNAKYMLVGADDDEKIVNFCSVCRNAGL